MLRGEPSVGVRADSAGGKDDFGTVCPGHGISAGHGEVSGSGRCCGWEFWAGGPLLQGGDSRSYGGCAPARARVRRSALLPTRGYIHRRRAAVTDVRSARPPGAEQSIQIVLCVLPKPRKWEVCALLAENRRDASHDIDVQLPRAAILRSEWFIDCLICEVRCRSPRRSADLRAKTGNRGRTRVRGGVRSRILHAVIGGLSVAFPALSGLRPAGATPHWNHAVPLGDIRCHEQPILLRGAGTGSGRAVDRSPQVLSADPAEVNLIHQKCPVWIKCRVVG